MNHIKHSINRLISADELSRMSSEEIVGHIALNMYHSDFSSIRENIGALPEVLRDILLLIDFDTELSMNGIVGFLENTSGCYLNETIKALGNIQQTKDQAIMISIKEVLEEHGICTEKLRGNMNHLTVNQVSYSSKTHGDDIRHVLMLVEKEAEQLYLYRDEEDLFDALFQYVEINQDELIKDIKRIV